MFLKRCHKYIVLALVVALLFVFACPAASADDTMAYTDRQRVSAFIGAALTALNITLGSVAAPVVDAYNYLSDPLDVVYTYQDELLSDYYDKSVIEVYPNYIEIDGTHYTDIYFGNKPAEMFRVNAGDLETAWAITSNSSGTAASGAGYLLGVPIFRNGSTYFSQVFSFPYTNGSWAFGSATVSSSPSPFISGNTLWTYSNPYKTYDLADYSPSLASSRSPCFLVYRGSPGSFNLYKAERSYSDLNSFSYVTGSGGSFEELPFDYTWVAGEIPADPIPDSDTGLMIRVPASDVQDWVNDHPEYSAPGGVNIDLDVDPSVSVDIDDLVDKLIPLIPIIPVGDITFAPQHSDSPAPQPVPDVPDSTLLPQTPWGNLRDRLDRIIETIQNIPTPTFPSLQPIIDSITSLGDKILQDIQRGPIDIFDKGIDVLRDLFAPFFSGLSAALGIWHYVVDWLGSISAPFYWILGIASGTSGIILGPVYAMVAGCIVIAIYRRFGR